MRENVKISKIDKKRETNYLKNIKFLSKKVETVLYLLNKCLKMKVHKILERQTNVYVSILCSSYYFKYIERII